MPGPIVVGAVAVDVVPSAKNFMAELANSVLPQTKKIADRAGAEFAKPIEEGITAGTRAGLRNAGSEAKDAGAKAGDKFADAFATHVKAAMTAAERAIGKVEITPRVRAEGLDKFVADVKAAQQAAARLAEDGAQVDVKLSDGEFFAQVAAVEAELGRLRQSAHVTGRLDFNLGASLASIAALKESIAAANVTSGEFARTLSGSLKGALLALPNPALDMTLSGTEETVTRLADIRGRMDAIRNLKLGIDIDDQTAISKVKQLERDLTALRASTTEPRLALDIEKALAQLGTFLAAAESTRAKIEEPIEIRLREGDLGAVVQKLVAGFSNVSATIGVRTELDRGKYDAELAKIKTDAKDITLRIGVDMSVGDAVAKALALRAELKAILKDFTIDIKTRGEATAALAETERLLEGVGIDAESAAGGVSKFVQRLQNMTPAAALANVQAVALFAGIPALVAIGSAAVLGLTGIIVTLGAALGAAALGVGVVALAFAKVTGAIKAKEAAQKAAASNAVQDQQTELANSIALANATDAITSAQKTLDQARTTSQRATKDDAAAVAAAGKNLRQAQDRETQARKKLNEAYKTARIDIQLLTIAMRQNRAEQEQAVVSLAQAKQKLNDLYADPTASSLDISGAVADYNSKEDNLRKLQLEQQKNQIDMSKGVAGSDSVVSAQTELKNAIDAVGDATLAVTKAQESQKRNAIDNALAIDSAEKALDKARTDRANTLQQQQQAAQQTMAQRAEVTKPYDDSPQSIKDFTDFYEKNIKPAFADLEKSAADSGVLYAIEDFFTAIKPLLPDLKSLIMTTGTAVATFIRELGYVVSSKEGKQFIAFLQKEIPVAFDLFTRGSKKALPSILEIIEKLAPLAEKLGPTLVDLIGQLADRFLKFAEDKGPNGLPQLLNRIEAAAPAVLAFLVAAIPALVTLLEAFAPLGEAMLYSLVLLAKVINFIGPLGLSGTITNLMAIASLIGSRWSSVWGGIRDVVSDVVGGIRKTFSEGMSYLEARLIETRNRIGAAWAILEGLLAMPIHGFFSVLNGLIHVLNDNLLSHFGSFRIHDVPEPAVITRAIAAGGAAVQNFAAGGVVDGRRGVILPGYRPGVDDVPSMLSQGEAVLVPQVARAIGRDTIEAWNADGLAGRKVRFYATGGLVDLAPDIVAFQRRSGVPFTVTSTYRPGANDYHGQRMAVDVASTPGNMVKQASWEYGYAPYLLELIHSGGPGYFVKNGRKVGADYYRSVYSEHFDHVHTAMNRAGLLGAKIAADPQIDNAGDTATPTGLAATLLGHLASALQSPLKPFVAKYKDTTIGQALATIPQFLTGKMGAWVIGKIAELEKDVISGAVRLGSEALDVGKSITDFLHITSSDTKTPHAAGDMASPLTAAGYAKSKLGGFNWTTGDWAALTRLWNGESGWRWNAKNPGSGAYGIPQALPAGKMGAAGPDWPVNAFTQIDWGMGYIASTYGDPVNAYAKWLSREPHWYDEGGYLPPGLTVAMNGTGKPERILTEDQWRALKDSRHTQVGVTVRVQDGAVPGLISAEVDRQFGQLADASIYGGA